MLAALGQAAQAAPVRERGGRRYCLPESLVVPGDSGMLLGLGNSTGSRSNGHSQPNERASGELFHLAEPQFLQCPCSTPSSVGMPVSGV